MLLEDSHLAKSFAPKNGSVDPLVTLVGYDKGTDEQEDERTIILAKANMLIYFSDLLADYHSAEDLQAFADKGLNSVFRLLRTNLGSFERTADEPYDLILTNPPYVTKGSKSLQQAVEQGEHTRTFYDLGLKGTEGLALNWILKSLRPGGEALVIVPDGLLRRDTALRALQQHCLIRAIVSLPTRTFYSTTRRTYILALEKKRGGVVQADPVFAYIVGEIGETRDNLRLEIEENHLNEMVPLFRQFRAAPNQFINNSVRCQIVPFSKVLQRTDWRVDRWLTHEERVHLNLDEKRPTVAATDFIIEVESHASDLLEAVQSYRQQNTEQLHVSSRTVTLANSIFSYVTEKTGWTKTALHQLATENETSGLPVYTAAANPLGYAAATHEKVILASPDSLLISFAANGDGSAGKNFVLHDCPFFVTRDRTVIRINDARIDASYVLWALRDMKIKYGFDHTHKAVPKNLGIVSFDIPVDNSCNWDLDAQKQIVTRYRMINGIRDLLNSKATTAARYEIH